MSREIGNSGYGLTDNPTVVADSDDDSIRIPANLNNDTDLNQANEAVRFVLQDDNDVIVRVENTGTSGVLATGITDLKGGGGNRDTFGSILVARFGPGGGFLAPPFAFTGGVVVPICNTTRARFSMRSSCREQLS